MTEELRTEYILNMYEELTTLNDCEHIILVREKATGLLFVKKILAHFEKTVYETLKDIAKTGETGPTYRYMGLRDKEAK